VVCETVAQGESRGPCRYAHQFPTIRGEGVTSTSTDLNMHSEQSCKLLILCAAITYKQEVAGSSPALPTNLFTN
jgi:hypothetical protein